MKRKYACPDFSFPMVRHDQALKIIQTLEFEGVDIGLMKDRTHLQPADQLIAPEKSGQALGERLRAQGLKPSDLFLQAGLDFSQVAINRPEPKARGALRELFVRALDYACAMGSGHMTVLPGASFGGGRDGLGKVCGRVDMAGGAGPGEIDCAGNRGAFGFHCAHS